MFIHLVCVTKSCSGGKTCLQFFYTLFCINRRRNDVRCHRLCKSYIAAALWHFKTCKTNQPPFGDRTLKLLISYCHLLSSVEADAAWKACKQSDTSTLFQKIQFVFNQIDPKTMQCKFFALLQKYSTAILHRLLTRPTTMQICSCLPSSGKCQNLFWEIKVTEFKQTGQVEVTRDDWNPKFSQIYNSGKASGGRRWPSEASQKDTRDSQHFSHCSSSTILFLASDGRLSQRQTSDRLEMVPVCSGCNVSAYWLGQSRSEESRPMPQGWTDVPASPVLALISAVQLNLATVRKYFN